VRHKCGVTLPAAGLPELLPATAEVAASEGDDGIGTADGPAHSELLEPFGVIERPLPLAPSKDSTVLAREPRVQYPVNKALWPGPVENLDHVIQNVTNGNASQVCRTSSATALGHIKDLGGLVLDPDIEVRLSFQVLDQQIEAPGLIA